MYKIKHGLAPEYLLNLLPPEVSQTTHYDLRNSNNIVIPQCRTNLLKNSFFPSTISAWNALPTETRNLDSINAFKKRLSKGDPPPKYLSYGDKKLNSILTRMRHNVSLLKADLFKFRLSDNTKCSCGYINENTEHFILYCKNYTEIRKELFHTIKNNKGEIDLDKILFGDPNLGQQNNINIVKAVHKYIKNSKRFFEQ